MNRISSFGDSATAAIRDNPFSAAWTQIQRKSSLLSIFMMGTYAECACCVHVLYSRCAINDCVCVCVYCLRWCLHRNVRAADLLASGARRLILHGLSKCGEEDRSRCSRYRMHPAVVPSAWIHMSDQTDLFPCSFCAAKTKMLNTDMYSTFMRTWADSLSEGSVERYQIQKQHRDEWPSPAEPVLCSTVVTVHRNMPIMMIFVAIFRPLFRPRDRLKKAF